MREGDKAAGNDLPGPPAAAAPRRTRQPTLAAGAMCALMLCGGACASHHGTDLGALSAYFHCGQQLDLSTARDDVDGVTVAVAAKETSPDAPPRVTLSFSTASASAIGTDAVAEVKAYVLRDGEVVAGTRVMPAEASDVPLTMDAVNHALELSSSGKGAITADARAQDAMRTCPGTTWSGIWADAEDYTVLGLVLHATPLDANGSPSTTGPRYPSLTPHTHLAGGQ